MIRRPPRSTLDRSSAASDVYKRQAVVGADHQTVFAGLAHDVRNIIAIFAGHIHAKCAKWILGPRPAEGSEAIPRFMHYPGQPLRARFNETKTKPGKDLM